jgi:thymidylate synthase (FAD)
MKVELLETMGTDLTVVNSARVSYNKHSSQYSVEKNEKLIKYLAKHGHWSPFAHITAQFYIKAPIFVARQLAKHQIGLVWNEVSLRYVESDLDFWEPTSFRRDQSTIKQGSGKDLIGWRRWLVAKQRYDEAIEATKVAYKNLLETGVTKEQARSVLPVATMTEWYWTGSVLAFARVCNLRMEEHAQEETRHIAEVIDKRMRTKFPLVWSALRNE